MAAKTGRLSDANKSRHGADSASARQCGRARAPGGFLGQLRPERTPKPFTCEPMCQQMPPCRRGRLAASEFRQRPEEPASHRHPSELLANQAAAGLANVGRENAA